MNERANKLKMIHDALEHTGTGGLIEIEIIETAVMLKITFKDNGSGIYPDDLPHVFKRFYRSRHAQKKQSTGIGLALTKTIIEAHGGYICAQSRLGQGSSFIITFPKLSIV